MEDIVHLAVVLITFSFCAFLPPQADPLLPEPCRGAFPSTSHMLVLQNPTGGRAGFENTRKAARIGSPFTWSRSEQTSTPRANAISVLRHEFKQPTQSFQSSAIVDPHLKSRSSRYEHKCQMRFLRRHCVPESNTNLCGCYANLRTYASFGLCPRHHSKVPMCAHPCWTPKFFLLSSVERH